MLRLKCLFRMAYHHSDRTAFLQGSNRSIRDVFGEAGPHLSFMKGELALEALIAEGKAAFDGRRRAEAARRRADIAIGLPVLMVEFKGEPCKAVFGSVANPLGRGFSDLIGFEDAEMPMRCAAAAEQKASSKPSRKKSGSHFY